MKEISLAIFNHYVSVHDTQEAIDAINEINSEMKKKNSSFQIPITSEMIRLHMMKNPEKRITMKEVFCRVLDYWGNHNIIVKTITMSYIDYAIAQRGNK